jgi:hypothetical protein
MAKRADVRDTLHGPLPTNVFGKKWENHGIMLSLFFGVYNFCKVHGTLKTTPAVAAGLTDHVWTVRELLGRAASTALAA